MIGKREELDSHQIRMRGERGNFIRIYAIAMLRVFADFNMRGLPFDLGKLRPFA